MFTAKVLVDLAKTQDEEVGDGTTSVTVLAAELLREAEKLIAMKLHPQTIIAGWRKAKVAALEALEQSAVSHVSHRHQTAFSTLPESLNLVYLVFSLP